MKKLYFKYEQQDLKVLSVDRNLNGYGPVNTLVHSAACDRQYAFDHADHEKIARDALHCGPVLRKLTRTRIKEFADAGGRFRDHELTLDALHHVKNVEFRRAYLTASFYVVRSLAVRFMSPADLKPMISDRSIVVKCEVFRWGDQDIQNTLYPVLMGSKSQTAYRIISKYALDKKHRTNALLRRNWSREHWLVA